MKFEVVPHDEAWAAQAEAESILLSASLEANCRAVHHIGSTSIPGIHAKPILDFLVEVRDIREVDQLSPALEVLGYEALGEFGIEGRRYFRRDDEDGVRTHHVHVFASGSAQIVRHLAFRDYLREHDEWAQRYSELKRRLAAAHADDPEAYMDGKHDLIQEIDRLAAEWLAASEAQA